MRVVYVIAWRYGDGSGSGAVSAHGTREDAETMLEILVQQDSMRSFSIHPVPFQDATPAPQDTKGADHE